MANIAPKAVLALLIDATTLADATLTVIRPFTVLDVSALGIVTAFGATLQIKRGASALTDVMVCAVAGNLTRCASLALAERSFAVSDTIVVDMSGANGSGQAIVKIQPTAITGGT